MPDTKISAMTAGAAMGAGDILPALQAAANVKVTGAQLKTWAQSGLAAIATSGSGADLAADSVALSKLPNAIANSKLLGSGAAGAGADYAELTLGTNLSMTGTTLNAGTAALGTAAFLNMAVGTSPPGSPATNDLWVDTN